MLHLRKLCCSILLLVRDQPIPLTLITVLTPNYVFLNNKTATVAMFLKLYRFGFCGKNLFHKK